MSQSPLPFDAPREELVEFDGDQLIAIVLDSDGVAVPLRIMCESTEENLYQLLFGQFKATFRLPWYDALPARRYEEALTWLKERAAEFLPDDPNALPPHQEQLL
jgi:hypothetical protein